ncbi:hypothetical protein [Deinococcus soli (ex Cha et al. 2016)]|uniref:Uncharacterized protein n=2 Tax=Deinococcus soli (ex Cha et al. 2016) TaxID=1309411 RepID=A0ACC6KKI0_9DEIO|nr:hypothetical protein [Deinococcus soli (ex Cha et al. 2016)]MDR6218642.1 hypothetical protein [Deinococcus soli (ex Cha et al. 2016)]MDR6328439.1 hypothetical protein [Deinococcus soli (ex Cha et al. 2016)]MDR6753050.1 hypothetical protein [Deinococcus soli (ex Cha et al. 2016)]
MSTLYPLDGYSNTTANRALSSLARSYGERPQDFAERLYRGDTKALAALKSLAGKLHARRGPGFTRPARMRGARDFTAATRLHVKPHVFDELLTTFGPLRAAPTGPRRIMAHTSSERATDRQIAMLAYLEQPTTDERGRPLTKQAASFRISHAPLKRDHYERLLSSGFDVIRERWCFDQYTQAMSLAQSEGLSVNPDRLRFLRQHQ